MAGRTQRGRGTAKRVAVPLVAQLETLAALVTAPPGVLAALMLAALGAPSAGSASAALSQSHCPRQLLSRSSH